MGDVPPQHEHDAHGGEGRHADAVTVGAARSGGKRFAFAAVMGAAFLLFTALGIWQVERLQWKLGLIAAVDQRVHAPPVPAPGPNRWPGLTAASDQYRHVRVAGTFLNDRETLVQAVTDYGAGYWVMTPLRTDEGWIVLVNRGFVPAERRDFRLRAAGQIQGRTSVTGLLRISEPKGAFLRHNDPSAARWYSRDVEAIASARRLDRTAPYFIDADSTPNAGGYPIGGLTVVKFRNAHLSYALTWFGMALLSLWGLWTLLRPRTERAM